MICNFDAFGHGSMMSLREEMRIMVYGHIIVLPKLNPV